MDVGLLMEKNNNFLYRFKRCSTGEVILQQFRIISGNKEGVRIEICKKEKKSIKFVKITNQSNVDLFGFISAKIAYNAFVTRKKLKICHLEEEICKAKNDILHADKLIKNFSPL